MSSGRAHSCSRASLCVTAFLHSNRVFPLLSPRLGWSRMRHDLQQGLRDVRRPPHITHTGEFEAVLSLGRKTFWTSCGRRSAGAHSLAHATHERAQRALCRLRPPRDQPLYHRRSRSTLAAAAKAEAACNHRRRQHSLLPRRRQTAVVNVVLLRIASRRRSTRSLAPLDSTRLVKAPRELPRLFGISESSYHIHTAHLLRMKSRSYHVHTCSTIAFPHSTLARHDHIWADQVRQQTHQHEHVRRPTCELTQRLPTTKQPQSTNSKAHLTWA